MAGVWVLIAIVICLALATAALFFWRIRSLEHRVGSFECALYLKQRWIAGIATYTRDHLDFYGVVSLSLRPTRRWPRREMEIIHRQGPSQPGALSEVRCSWNGQEFHLAAEDGALDGLRSWLEAAPPDASTSQII